MSETTMPAAEAGDVTSYELAFHVLPTVAEGEVPTVFATIKDHITNNGGAIFDEEAPERFDLAYEIVKYLEGRNRKFSSAYFGWVRFTVAPDKLDEIMAEIDDVKELLRHLVIKLTKVEEENPFRFHEAIESKVETVEAEVAETETAPAEPDDAPAEDAETETEADDESENKTDDSEDGEEATDKV